MEIKLSEEQVQDLLNQLDAIVEREWKSLQIAEEVYGLDHQVVLIQRARWGAYFTMQKEVMRRCTDDGVAVS